MVLRMMEEAIDPAVVSRISGIPVDDLLALGVVRKQPPPPSEEELGAHAARLAQRSLQEADRIFDEGSEPSRIRLIAALAGHPMRRMQTDLGAQTQELQSLLSEILHGGPVVPDDQEEDETEGAQP